MRTVGTVVRGIRTPIIKEGDDLANIVVESLMKAKETENITFNDRDIVAVTEAVVGISEGNYGTLDQIAKDIQTKLKSDHIGVVYPILSRNRFAVLLKAISRSTKKVTILCSYPSDEEGNDILYVDDLEKNNVNPYSDIITSEEYSKNYSHFKHLFTGINMFEAYKEIVEKENCEFEMIFGNHPEMILDYTKDIIVANVHGRFDTKKKLMNKGCSNIIGLSDILKESVDGSGCCEYGLLGSNRSTDEKVKLFPRNGKVLVDNIQKKLIDITGKNIEVMIYGDGAFKDPVGKIWELADPVVSPAFTKGLEGQPNELKLKYLSENKLKDLHGEELIEAMKKEIRNKDKDLKGQMVTQGTTPRRITDLIGSLCDLTSGSGDKGTPVVFIQGYFDNYSN